MSERLKEVRSTLKHARGALSKLDSAVGSQSRDGHTRVALDNLTNALDVLTGEVEALTSWQPRVNAALTALKDFCRVVKEFHTS